MSRPVVAASLQGRTGNCMFTVAFAKAYAERHGFEFQCDDWIGKRVFGLNDPPIAEPEKLKRVDENTLVDGEGDVCIRSYCQNQKSLIYTRRDCLRWFQFSDEIENAMRGYNFPEVVGHRRVGDYPGYGIYPVVSEASYHRAMSHYYHTSHVKLHLLTEESPTIVPLPEELKDIPDFYLMTKALVLFRGNSSFSWWAAVLNEVASVYSPIVAGLPSREQDCIFVPGNWPRFANMEFTTDLHLPE